jgi:quercetin dioxygenase-like cupin family protein
MPALLRRSAAWARLAAPPPAAASDASDAGAPLRRRRLADVDVFRLPGQSNRVALLYDPLSGGRGGGVAFTASVEIYEPGHVTPRHTHAAGTELFLVLASKAVAHCNGVSARLRPGDAVAFPPGAVHALDVPAAAPGRCHALQLLLPDEASEYAAYVRAGDPGAALDEADLRVLHAATQECPCEAQHAAAVQWHA